MTELMMLLAFITGAMTVYYTYTLALTHSGDKKPSERPQTPRIEASEPKVQPEAEVDLTIEKALTEIKPPNLFERRATIEELERKQEEERKRTLLGLQ